MNEKRLSVKQISGILKQAELGWRFRSCADITGALVARGEVDTGSAAVAEVLNGRNLYVLTSDAQAAPLNVSGGQLAHFTLASGGTPSEMGSTQITLSNPSSMALMVAP